MRINKILFCICAAILFSGCAGTATPKKIVFPIDARFAAVCFKGYQDLSGIQSIEHWPKDSLQNRILLSYLGEISASLQEELKKYAKKGRYTFVDRAEVADIVIELNFLKHTFAGKTLVMPVEVVVGDLRSKQTSTWAFTSFGEGSGDAGPGGGDDYYFHLFGAYVAGVKRNFPAFRIAELFFPHEE